MPESSLTEAFKSELSKLPPRTKDVVELSAKLCSIPGISVPVEKADHAQILMTYRLLVDFAKERGLQVIEMESDEQHPFPYVMITFSEIDLKEEKRDMIALVGHIDVVGVKPEDFERQFTPVIEDGMLKARGAADMKTVVATYLVWMAEQQQLKGAKAPIVLMLSCTEENASVKPHGTQHAIQYLQEGFNVKVALAIVGERTGELETMPEKEFGPICVANRGWRWYEVEGNGVRNGYAALTLLAAVVQQGRLSIVEMNSQPSSDRMNEQANWRSGFVPSFVRIGADKEIEAKDWPKELVFHKGGASLHSAAIDVSQKSFVEHAWDIAKTAMDAFGEEHVLVKKVEAGRVGDYNTVSYGGTLQLVISAEQEAIDAWSRENNPEGFEAVHQQEASVSENKEEHALPVMGLDIRDIPEHTDEVNKWLVQTRVMLSSLGMDFKTINDGDGWGCPADNSELQRLISAYEQVKGEKAVIGGKLHGNDGRFFEGKAVVWGQVGVNPHGPNEAHQIASILPYMLALDSLAKGYRVD